MYKPSQFLSVECFGNSTIEDPSLSPDDSEIPDPVKKFLEAEALRGPIEAVRDMGWDDVVAADVRKGAVLPDIECDDFEVVRNEIRVQQDGVTLKVGVNKCAQVITCKILKF